jgi:hypothetical protein
MLIYGILDMSPITGLGFHVDVPVTDIPPRWGWGFHVGMSGYRHIAPKRGYTWCSYRSLFGSVGAECL